MVKTGKGGASKEIAIYSVQYFTQLGLLRAGGQLHFALWKSHGLSMVTPPANALDARGWPDTPVSGDWGPLRTRNVARVA